MDDTSPLAEHGLMHTTPDQTINGIHGVGPRRLTVQRGTKRTYLVLDGDGIEVATTRSRQSETADITTANGSYRLERRPKSERPDDCPPGRLLQVWQVRDGAGQVVYQLMFRSWEVQLRPARGESLTLRVMSPAKPSVAELRLDSGDGSAIGVARWLGLPVLRLLAHRTYEITLSPDVPSQPDPSLLAAVLFLIGCSEARGVLVC